MSKCQACAERVVGQCRDCVVISRFIAGETLVGLQEDYDLADLEMETMLRRYVRKTPR
jgi:hypothetical protein